MSSIARVTSAVEGEAPHLINALRHHPALAERFGELYGAFWTSPTVPPRVKEIARMRNARITDCGFCRNVRFSSAVEDGLDERSVDDITDDYETSELLSAREKAVLRFTDAMIHDPALMTPATADELKQHFSNEQIAELGLGVTLFLALAKVLITMGLEPESMERTVLPTPGTVAPVPQELAA